MALFRFNGPKATLISKDGETLIENSFVLDKDSKVYRSFIGFIKTKYKNNIKRVIDTGNFEKLRDRFKFCLKTGVEDIPITIILVKRALVEEKYAFRIYAMVYDKIPIVAKDRAIEYSEKKKIDKNNALSVFRCPHRYVDGNLAFEADDDESKIRCKKCGRKFDIDCDLPFLPIYEEICTSSFDINNIKLNVKPLKNDKFELSIYLNSKESEDEKSDKISDLAKFIEQRYHSHYNFYLDSEYYDIEHDYRITMEIHIKNIKLMINLLSDILENTTDKTTRIYHAMSIYLKRLKHNKSHKSFSTYSYINILFNHKKKPDVKVQPYYEDVENATIQQQVPKLGVYTKKEALMLLEQVTLYFKSIIDYCEENGTRAIVTSSTVPHFSGTYPLLIKAEIISAKISINALNIKASNISVYIENTFIISRCYNDKSRYDKNEPIYKLKISDRLK